MEDAVRGGRGWRAAARERQHAVEAARREVRQQRGERHRASGWVWMRGWTASISWPPPAPRRRKAEAGHSGSNGAAAVPVRRRPLRGSSGARPHQFSLEDLSFTSSLKHSFKNT